METIILPGMGADSRMYPGKSYENIPSVIFAEWPEYQGEESIDQVAESVIENYHIKPDTTVGGSSLGGMVALRIARILNLKKVILIGSATGPEFVNPVLKRLSHLSDLDPINLIQLLSGMFNTEGGNDVVAMLEDADNRFINAMCKAIFNWNGVNDFQCEICHIHGSDDKVILPPDTGAEIITGGGHLIAMTHGTLVADFIKKQIEND